MVHHEPEIHRQTMKRFQQWLYRRRIRHEWKRAKGDYGQFLSNVGYRIARGHLPKEIVEEL